MFLYKNGRLHVGPISVAPPEGFYLDPDTPDAYANALRKTSWIPTMP